MNYNMIKLQKIMKRYYIILHKETEDLTSIMNHVMLLLIIKEQLSFLVQLGIG